MAFCLDVVRRCSVKISSSTARCHSTLPKAQMRALVALYHQSETFITPETLNARIDEAFLGKDDTALTALRTDRFIARTPFRDMNTVVETRRREPRRARWDSFTESNDPPSARREQRVIEAIYGLQSSPKNTMMPGWEALEDNLERIYKEQKA